MYCRKNGKIIAFLWAVVFIVVLGNCTEAKMDETEIFVQVNRERVGHQYDEIVSRLGEIWIGYTAANGKMINSLGFELFFIERINYYYKKDGNFIFLGRVDRATGVHDKDGKLIRAIPTMVPGQRVFGFSNPSEPLTKSEFQVVALSSITVEGLHLTIDLIVQLSTDSSYFDEVIEWAFLAIDVENKTIKLHDPFQ